MEMIAAAILGFVQGLTEFLPVSSSAHLILVPWLFGWDPEGLLFDVSLHVGTALAILVYFWKDWVNLARESFQGIRERSPLGNQPRRLAWCIVIGTVPAFVAGLTMERLVGEHLRSPLIPVMTLVAFGALLHFSERRSSQQRSLAQLNVRDSIWIGISQAIALIPGVSRSGITISAAMLRNLDRASATRFSFLLSAPAVVGAGMLEAWHLVEALRDPFLVTVGGGVGPIQIKWAVLGTGIASSAITGIFCIRYFLRYVQSNSFFPFVSYRYALAVAVLFLYLRQGLRG